MYDSLPLRKFDPNPRANVQSHMFKITAIVHPLVPGVQFQTDYKTLQSYTLYFMPFKSIKCIFSFSFQRIKLESYIYRKKYCCILFNDKLLFSFNFPLQLLMINVSKLLCLVVVIFHMLVYILLLLTIRSGAVYCSLSFAVSEMLFRDNLLSLCGVFPKSFENCVNTAQIYIS